MPAIYSDSMTRFGFAYSPQDFETLNVEQYGCPTCGASDRERFYALYFNRYMHQDPVAPLRMLDFCPSASLDRFFRTKQSVSYATADLLDETVDHRGVDLTDLVFRDALFDFVICSHVLEHVADVDRALRELYRVLKPDARSIIMVPIVRGLAQTVEDPRHSTEADRWKHYGQGDHVRLFARDDFMHRIRSVGFELDVLGVEDFDPGDFRRRGISPTSKLYLATKPARG
jgi:SAM-dependent methyltransferase